MVVPISSPGRYRIQIGVLSIGLSNERDQEEQQAVVADAGRHWRVSRCYQLLLDKRSVGDRPEHPIGEASQP